jgi:hypothetical protein
MQMYVDLQNITSNHSSYDTIRVSALWRPHLNGFPIGLCKAAVERVHSIIIFEFPVGTHKLEVMLNM